MIASLSKAEARNLAWQFLLNTNKPSRCAPVDILLTANIILLSNDEGMCWASQSVLSATLGIQPKNIRRSLDRVIEHGWVIEQVRSGTQQSNVLMPQLHNIPFGMIRKADAGADAQRLAARYYETVRALPKVKTKNGRMRAAAYPHRGWPQHWSMVMQNWMDAGWSTDEIQAVVDYAFQTIGDRAKRGPQCIKRQFSKLAEDALARVTV